MQSTNNKNLAWLRVTAYFLITFLAALVASKVPAIDSIFYYLGISLLLSYFLLRHEGRRFTDFGLLPKSKGDWRQLVLGTFVGIAALLTCAALVIALSKGSLSFNGKIDLVFLFVLVVIHLFSAFAQEYAYRGYPFQTLLSAYGPWIAQFGVTLPFAVMHLKLSQPFTIGQFLLLWLATGIGSLLYGYAYLRTGKLVLAVGLHFGWNIAQALVPRSATESKTIFFTFVPGKSSDGMLELLFPYLMISMLLFWWVGRQDRGRSIKDTGNNKS